MEKEQIQFRTAVFGGFQKQDVMNYLEKSARDRAEERAALQRELADERVGRSGEAQQVGALKDRIAQLEEENKRLSEDVAERDRELAQAKERSQELEAQVEGLEQDVERLTPAAEAYIGLKERAAGIELEAHARAQSIEDESRRKAEKVREELLEWMDDLEDAFDGLRGKMDTAVAHAAGELIRLGRELEDLPQRELGEQGEALKALRLRIQALETTPFDTESGK